MKTIFNPQAREQVMKKLESYNDNGKDVTDTSEKGVIASVWAHPAGMFFSIRSRHGYISYCSWWAF